MQSEMQFRTEMFSLEAELVRLSQDALKLEQKVTELFELLRGPVQRYLAAVLGDAAAAEDLTQETFLRLYQCLHSGQAIKNVRAWLFRVAHNLAIDHKRTNKNLDVMDFAYEGQLQNGSCRPGSNPEQKALDHEKLRMFHAGLAQLSPQERQCMNLRAEGLRYREIADILRVSPSSVAEFLRRAICKLSRDLNE